MAKFEDIQLNLKPFDMTKMDIHSVCVCVGARKSGKSILIRDILFNKRKELPAGLVMSHTDHLAHFYDKFIPSILIHKHYDTNQLSKLFQRQEKALKDQWSNPNAFLLLDDVLSDKAWKNDPNMSEIYYNGRHYKLLSILGMQTPMGIPSGLRGQIDYTFIFKTNIESDKKKLFEHYAGCLKTLEVFKIVLDATTEDYHCLVINNNCKSGKLEDCVFYYKAKMHDDFKMCSNDIWQLNEKHIFREQQNKFNGNNYSKIEQPINKGKSKMIINKKTK
jgi:hypothetical protein